MKFIELATARKSVRQYLQKEVEPEKLDYIMECARLAPSAANFQPWFFYVVKSQDVKNMLYDCYPKKWFISNPSPLYIVACGDTSQSWKREYDGKDHKDIDVAIAFEHICLAATEQGLGTCWICDFDASKLKAMMNLPENLYPIAITPVGYPISQQPNTPLRKTQEEIISII